MVQPNIVLITADDMRPDDLEAMPFTRDQLTRGGVTFTDAISPYPLCCPARAAILTGQYSHNNGVRSNRWPNGSYWALRGLRNTLPVWLQDAGYRTGFVGKFLNGYEYEPPRCDEGWCRYLRRRRFREIPPGWDRWHTMVEHTYEYRHVGLVSRVGNGPVRSEVSNTYQTLRLSELADETVNDFHESDAPFFLWYSSAAPHVSSTGGGVWEFAPPIPQQSYEHDFDGVSLPTDPLFIQSFDEDTEDKAGPMAGLPALTRDQKEFIRMDHEGRLESLRSLDDAVERLITTLRDLGELDSTVVIFTSDNGYSLGEHRWHGKSVPYEAGLRVPMIIRAPGLGALYDPASSSDAAVESPFTVTTSDIPATIVALSGGAAGRALDGLDMTRPEANPDFNGGDPRCSSSWASSLMHARDYGSSWACARIVGPGSGGMHSR